MTSPHFRRGFQIHPPKTNMSLKMDYFNRKCIFQPSLFRGYVWFSGWYFDGSLDHSLSNPCQVKQVKSHVGRIQCTRLTLAIVAFRAHAASLLWGATFRDPNGRYLGAWLVGKLAIITDHPLKTLHFLTSSTYHI